MEVLQRLELCPALVRGGVVDVRLQIEVAATHQAKAFAVGAAERRERGREDDLLTKERREIDAKVAPDRLRVAGSRVLGVAAQDVDRRVVLLREVGPHRGLDRLQAT